MKLIRLALFSVLSLFAIASLIGMLLPAHVLVSRAVNITAPKDSILPYIKDIEQWKGWMDGMQQASVNIESSAHADFNGTNIAITDISDSSVVSTWVTKKGSPQTSTVNMIGDSLQKATIVQWQFEQKLKWYPWE